MCRPAHLPPNPAHPPRPPGPRRFTVARRCRRCLLCCRGEETPSAEELVQKKPCPILSTIVAAAQWIGEQSSTGETRVRIPSGTSFRTPIFASVASMTMGPIRHPLCPHTPLSTPTRPHSYNLSTRAPSSLTVAGSARVPLLLLFFFFCIISKMPLFCFAYN